MLLHGNGEDSSYWNAQIPELTRFYRVIAVDSRGHGASGSGGHGLSFEMMAEDLKTVLDTLSVKKAHFPRLFGRRQSGDQIRTDAPGIYR